MPELRQEWEEYKETTEDDEVVQEFAYRNARAAELLDDEDEDVKERVEKVRRGEIECIGGRWEDEVEDEDELKKLQKKKQRKHAR